MAEIENDDDIILPEGLVVRPVEPVKTQFGAVSFCFVLPTYYRKGFLFVD